MVAHVVGPQLCKPECNRSDLLFLIISASPSLSSPISDNLAVSSPVVMNNSFEVLLI